MTTLVTRSQWGALPPKAVSHDVDPVDGVAVHHVGAGAYAYTDHGRCAQLVRNIQRAHLTHPTEGYVDIAYSMLACQHGFMFEGRSKASDPKVRPGSNGTARANSRALSVCCLWGDADGEPTHSMLAAAAGAVAWLRAHATAGGRVSGHRDWSSTSCPGRLYPKLPTIKSLADQAGKQEPPMKKEYADYVSTYDREIPRGREVTLATVDLRDYKGQAILLDAQYAFSSLTGPGRPTRARVRFVRVPSQDGTAELDAIVTPGRWADVHNHVIMGGTKVDVRVTFRGRGRKPRLRYLHFKGARFA